MVVADISAAAAPVAPVPVPSGLYLILILAAVLVGGMALNLTPCIYPLIPITISYFGGRSETVQGSKVLHGMFYLLGLSVTNSTLGVIAALTGGLVGALLQNSVVLATIALILTVFALSLFGFWEIRLPARFNELAARTYGGYGGSLFMGLTLGVIAAPCIGPFVVGLLSWIAAIGKIWFGFTIFVTLSVGMGLPLFFLALFSSNIDRLPRSGEWMIWVKKLMGWILVAMAIYFIISPPLYDPWSVILYSFTATAAWCAPCRELDATTFRDPAVLDMATQIVMIKVDLTSGADETHQELLERYQVKGVPTVIFVDGEGRVRGDLRLVDYLPADQFVNRMKRLCDNGNGQQSGLFTPEPCGRAPSRSG